jgi:hypothetical protein
VYKTPFGLSCPLTFVPSLSWQMIVFHEEVYTEKERSGARDRTCGPPGLNNFAHSVAGSL